MWGDESEVVAPIIWLYQIVDAQKEEVFFPDLLITLRRYGNLTTVWDQELWLAPCTRGAYGLHSLVVWPTMAPGAKLWSIPTFYHDMQISWPDSGSPPIRLSDS